MTEKRVESLEEFPAILGGETHVLVKVNPYDPCMYIPIIIQLHGGIEREVELAMYMSPATLRRLADRIEEQDKDDQQIGLQK